MKVLIVVSGNHRQVAPFVMEQAEALQKAGCDVQLFRVEGHGALGYLRNLSRLKAAIRQFHPNVVHAHYGLCGLLCTLQRQAPVVVTYHGSDINHRNTLRLSLMAMRRAAHNIFVSKALLEKASQHLNFITRHSTVLPCGVNLDDFPIVDRTEARRRLGLHADGRYVLFAGAFNNPVKNAPLAQSACALLPDVTLIELKGYIRSKVALLMNAADALLMTSLSEGSPQVVKEALAAGLPIVSVDVGDVASLIEGTDFGAITGHTPEALAAALTPFLDNPCRTDGRQQIIAYGLDNPAVAQRLISLYSSL